MICPSYTLLRLFSVFFVEKRASSLACYKISAILQSARFAHVWEHDSKESSLLCHMVFPSEGKEFSSILKKTLGSSGSILAITGSKNASTLTNIYCKERKKILNRFNPFRKQVETKVRNYL